MAYLLLPLLFLQYWFIDLPLAMLSWIVAFNRAFLQLLSLPILIRTFFKPLKNEYREGLVRFSIVMGMVIKTILIFVDLLLFLLVVGIEFIIFIAFLILPFITVLLLFKRL